MTRSGEGKRSGSAKSRSPRKGDPAPAEGFASRQEVADYIASLLKDMQLLARQNRMPQLAYQIGVALEEAKDKKVTRG
ncbi:MAG: hypothetical protein QNJ62_10210 [Methyloceanibacter sp.]|nr:hypothetical protein [Methyloceanibacter sp.]